MAQIANTVSTTAAVGNREDLVNTIWNIDPHETPGLTLFDRITADAVNHEWLTGSLTAAGSNAQIEGNDADFSTAARPAEVRVGNRVQTAWKIVSVTGMQEAVKKAGRKSELAKELFKMGRELRTDIEWAIFSNVAKVTGNSSTAAKSAGMGAWVATNDVLGSAGSPASPTGDGTDARTDGTQEAFTEARLKTAILGCWTNGGQPDWLIMGGFNKQVFSGFDGIATKYQNAESGKIIAGVDYYESDFGMMKAIADRFSRARDVWVLQADLWAVGFVRNMFVKKLGPTGDAEKRMLICDFTLEARNESGNGLVADNTTS
ncbi:MAG: DUF5309 family protein [Alphaproteobacteria bacterium]